MVNFAKNSQHFSLDSNSTNGNNNSNDNSSSSNDKLDASIIDKIIDLNDNFEDRIALWILDKIVSKFGTQFKFDFGIYLSQFAVFQNNNNNTSSKNINDNNKSHFPKIYADYMEQQCGINWCITGGCK